MAVWVPPSQAATICIISVKTQFQCNYLAIFINFQKKVLTTQGKADIVTVMENKTLHMTEERYPIIAKVAEIADKERRSMAIMADILLAEAIAKRKLDLEDTIK